YARPAEVQPRGLDRGRGGVDLRLRSTGSLDRILELFSADGASRFQRRVAPDVELVFFERRLLLLELAARFVERRAVCAVVDLEEQIARLHRRPVSVRLPKEVALDAGPHLRSDEPLSRPDRLRVDRHVALGDLSDDDLWDWRRRRHRLPTSA